MVTLDTASPPAPTLSTTISTTQDPTTQDPTTQDTLVPVQDPGTSGGPTGGTRWLDDEEQRTWRVFLSATQLLMDRIDRQLQHESGVVHTYYEMLVRLSESPGRALRMSELADSSLSSRSRVSHAVSRMEERGWIRRDPCETDGRGYSAVLTDAGMDALRAAAPGHVETVRHELFDQLDVEQVGQLREISERLVRHLTSTGSVSPVPLEPTAG